jgi:D-xylose 1-dehydrogenase (NADP+, D-xylono-1,5-lactone-forming)
MSKIRWGILSAANIAYDQMVPALRRSENAVVSAIASRTKEKAKKFEVPTIYETYEELIQDETIDAIYIPLPNSLHKEWAIKAMDAGKHVLLEKPAVLEEKDMIEIKEAVERNNVVFMEAFMYQFHKQHEKVKELLDSGLIGEYQHVKSHFSYNLDNPNDVRLNKELGGGAMWDVGCYGMHAITQIVGMKPVKLSMTGHIHPEYDVDISSTCVLIDQHNRTAEISSSMELPFIDYYEIFGPEGTIRVDGSFRPDQAFLDRRGKVTVKDKQNNVIYQEAFQSDQYLEQVEHFQDCIKENRSPKYNASHSVEMVRYIQKSYESLFNHSALTEIPEGNLLTK